MNLIYDILVTSELEHESLLENIKAIFPKSDVKLIYNYDSTWELNSLTIYIPNTEYSVQLDSLLRNTPGIIDYYYPNEKKMTIYDVDCKVKYCKGVHLSQGILNEFSAIHNRYKMPIQNHSMYLPRDFDCIVNCSENGNDDWIEIFMANIPGEDAYYTMWKEINEYLDPLYYVTKWEFRRIKR